MRSIKLDFNEITYSYRPEAGGKGVKIEELRVYNNSKKMFNGIGRELDGWTDEIVYSIVNKFEEYGIREEK
ncbi:MAG: hypothetical protein ACOVRN_13195 [Flavobacterium sp.]